MTRALAAWSLVPPVLSSPICLPLLSKQARSLSTSGWWSSVRLSVSWSETRRDWPACKPISTVIT